MSGSRQPADARARERALDPTTSFIVQAPAGSGKTELLIQRYLRLLAIVDEPEEILAITFTRKAASEMRTRIEKALRGARDGAPPSDQAHLQRGYELALAVVARDRQCGWGLGEQPARLRISTIDSVNSRLSRRVPLSAGFTAQNTLLNDPEAIYREAARETLALAEDHDDNGAAVRTLLAHCDNFTDRVETLLKMMLERRDQWLSRTGSGRAAHEGELRIWLESTLGELVESYLRAACTAIPRGEADEIVACLAHAGECLAMSKPDADVAVWRDRTAMPAPEVDSRLLWIGMATSLLTQKGQWRSTVDKRNGFPVDNDGQRDMKARAMELLARLSGEEELRASLDVVRGLPEPRYAASQWAVIEALWTVLPLTVAILKQLFAERGLTDYTEIAQEALAALGDAEEATELRLALDYQIKHILLDEFQDTSRSQYQLIKQLTVGWEFERDRSLFLVGDPMQSIYRFREAEVGLFLETRADGIGGLKPEFLQLTTNFRSDPAIVDWFNSAFRQVFPSANDRASGAVQFTASRAFRDEVAGSGVAWHAVPYGEREVEAARIVTLIRTVLTEFPRDTIGILVRSRTHAAAIATQMRRAEIGFLATDMEKLHEQPVVQDLLALTRALTHLGDRLAWLACLRAPWCGLTLVDLHTLATTDRDACVWTLANQAAVVDRLSTDGQARLSRCLPVLRAGLERRGGIALRDLVESTWLQLGGPATIGQDARGDLELADHYFAFLASLDVDADCVDGAELLQRLSERPITRAGGDPQVQIMTMHKAKGLEFDTVILPGLGFSTRSSEKPLLLFHEFPRIDAESGLVVGPLKASDQAGDPLYDLLWRFEADKDRLEQDRLLYVAVTRARRRLHLFAQLQLEDSDEQGVRTPASNTLLSRLWPVAAGAIDTTTVELPVRVRKAPGERWIEWAEAPLRRLPSDWQLPEPPSAFGTIDIARQAVPEEAVEFEWASQWAKHVGSVTHRWLQHIAEEGVDAWDAQRVTELEPQLRRALRRAGVSRGDLSIATQRTATALQNTLSDKTGRWILGSYAEQANEFPVTSRDEVTADSHDNIVDRTFVDADGVRWIVDYKTSGHEGADLDGFLVSEANRYRPQLRRYRAALAALEQRPIRTALYFPLLQVFYEVDCDISE